MPVFAVFTVNYNGLLLLNAHKASHCVAFPLFHYRASVQGSLSLVDKTIVIRNMDYTGVVDTTASWPFLQ